MRSLHITIIGDTIDLEAYRADGTKIDMYPQSDRRVVFDDWKYVLSIIAQISRHAIDRPYRIFIRHS